jgi:predicted RNA binding protein YcfA (HicA-like mRNA interferase family)
LHRRRRAAGYFGQQVDGSGELDHSLLTDKSEVKVREAIKLIEDDGWFLVRTRGSHRQYKHAQKPGLVTIAGKPSDDLAPGTKNSILKQAGLK